MLSLENQGQIPTKSLKWSMVGVSLLLLNSAVSTVGSQHSQKSAQSAVSTASSQHSQQSAQSVVSTVGSQHSQQSAVGSQHSQQSAVDTRQSAQSAVSAVNASRLCTRPRVARRAVIKRSAMLSLSAHNERVSGRRVRAVCSPHGFIGPLHQPDRTVDGADGAVVSCCRPGRFTD